MKKIHSQVIPIDRKNVDTDQIIPAQFLKVTTKEGLGKHLFLAIRELEKDFPLNLEFYKNSEIMVSRENFGCGSSREHAAWSLKDWGIKVVIAPSFSDIFYSNALKNGILVLQLPENIVDLILEKALSSNPLIITVDLEQQTVIVDETIHMFAIDPFRKECLLNNLNDLDYLLSMKDKIVNYDKNVTHRFFTLHPIRKKIEEMK